VNIGGGTGEREKKRKQHSKKNKGQIPDLVLSRWLGERINLPKITVSMTILPLSLALRLLCCVLSVYDSSSLCCVMGVPCACVRILRTMAFKQSILSFVFGCERTIGVLEGPDSRAGPIRLIKLQVYGLKFIKLYHPFY